MVKLLKDIKALLGGLGIAGKHLGRHAITIQYPEERWTMPERSRGMVVLLSDKETGELNCTACMLCMRACPTGAIRIDAPKDDKKKRHLKEFVVDHGLCCFCGLCEEACNFAAIKMATKYEFSTLRKDELVYDSKKLQEMGRDVPYEPIPKKKPAAEKAAAPKPKPQKPTEETSARTDKDESSSASSAESPKEKPPVEKGSDTNEERQASRANPGETEPQESSADTPVDDTSGEEKKND